MSFCNLFRAYFTWNVHCMLDVNSFFVSLLLNFIEKEKRISVYITKRIHCNDLKWLWRSTSFSSSFNSSLKSVSLRGVIAKILDCDLEISEFEFQLCYYVHFRIGMNPLISYQCYSSTRITHKDWYAVKKETSN